MISFNFGGAKFTGITINLFNITFNKKKNNTDEHDPEKPLPLELKPIKKQKYVEYKTTLGGSHISKIGQLEGNIIVYLFIEKTKEVSFWNLVAPVILDERTNEAYDFELGCFALQGCGGGLSNMDSMFYHVAKLQSKGYKVSVIPKIIDNELLEAYSYIDSNVKLEDLIRESNKLIECRKNEFISIQEKFEELATKHKIISF